MTHRLMVADRRSWWEPWEPSLDVRKAPRRARTRLKQAEKLLRKFGVWPKRKFEKTEWVQFDGRSLIEGIIKSERDIRALYNGEVERILVGMDTMSRFINDLDAMFGSFAFTERMKLGTPEGVRIVGIDVQFVPWMRGVLLVPKLENGRRDCDVPIFDGAS